MSSAKGAREGEVPGGSTSDGGRRAGAVLLARLREANPDISLAPATDPSFVEFGRIIDDLPTAGLADWMSANVPVDPEGGYQRSIGAMEDLVGPSGKTWRQWASRSLYGGAPAQVGWVAGRNTRLNAFEYHKASECLIAATPLVLLLGRMADLEDFSRFDSAKVRGYFMEAGMAIELYATSLHFSPVMAEPGGFRAAIILPSGTNAALEGIDSGLHGEDGLLRAERKWLLACRDTKPARAGARVGMENIELRIG